MTAPSMVSGPPTSDQPLTRRTAPAGIEEDDVFMDVDHVVPVVRAAAGTRPVDKSKGRTRRRKPLQEDGSEEEPRLMLRQDR